MAQLKEGMPAPTFRGTGHDGKMVDLEDFREQGKRVVIASVAPEENGIDFENLIPVDELRIGADFLLDFS